jgi:DNA helicase-2/ATP-dependent DNA helicase PcrA
MLTWAQFCEHSFAVTDVPLCAAQATLARPVNQGQARIVGADLSQSLYVIAGPGSGKTTASTLRVLKLLFVDSVDPHQMVATTFTRRAAAVLRGRIIEWGEALRHRLLTASAQDAARIERLDFNQLRVGTIDSIAQDLLTEYRAAGAPRPSPVEEHVFKALMMAEGVRTNEAAHSKSLCNFLSAVGFNTFGGQLGLGGRAEALVEVRERLINDRIDRSALRANAQESQDNESRGLIRALDAIEAFEAVMRQREIFDFAGLNEYFLHTLENGAMAPFLRQLRFILVDEYQYTNYLQESIYLKMAAAARENGGSICVVGDDDQSLYRFRGATVELFAEFRARLQTRCGMIAQDIALNHNYRSTQTIVTLVDEFSRSDAIFQQARIARKPALVHGGANSGVLPLIGILRGGEQALAQGVAAFVDQIVNGGGAMITDRGGGAHRIQLDPQHGSASDIAVLFDSAAEYSGSNRERFPYHLRRALGALPNAIRVFNPRGQPLKRQPAVRELLGLALLCLDHDASTQAGARLARDVSSEFTAWRQDARTFLTGAPPELARFVAAWGARRPTRPLHRPTNVTISDLLYKLVTWLPAFHEDVEHLAWLEALLRAVAAASLVRGFHGEVVFTPRVPADPLGVRSVTDAMWRVFVPIADDVIQVEEDLLETLPHGRISFLTIHQSKGLEFPITIVDIGSELGDGRVARDFKRYPSVPARAHLLEDRFRAFSGIALTPRTGVDRAFDDLTREYFVAFSRAQDLLVLVGDDVSASGGRPRHTMASVATGWRRPRCVPANLWPWRGLPFLERW